MGLVDTVVDTITGGPKSLFQDSPEGAINRKDFEFGLEITEMPPSGVGLSVTLFNNQLPQRPFTFGGEQRTVKEYYPGNSEPTIQVLGPTEDDLVFQGRLHDKRMNSQAAQGKFLSEAIVEILDDIRQRGHLCQLFLGEFVRWGILKKTEFDLMDRRDFNYRLTFEVIGEQEPTQCPQITTTLNFPDAELLLLVELAGALAERQSSIPKGIGLSLFGAINKAISTVAEVVSGVIDFANSVIDVYEEAASVANKLVGIVQYAKTEAFKAELRLGQISYSLVASSTALASKVQFGTILSPETIESYKTTANLNVNSYIADLQSFIAGIRAQLELLRKQFEAYRTEVPQARYLVKDGDTLQKVSVKFYGAVDNWHKIRDFNKLSSTVIAPPQVLEIPKLGPLTLGNLRRREGLA